ncbi:MAG: hypothetical protein ABID84_03815 [Chloroflexota bacterium]
MELSSLIEKLEEVVSSGTGVPATGRILVEREKLTDLVSQIRIAFPADIQEAQDLLQMRENVISQALLEARRIRSAAEEEARARLTESEVTKDAHKRSEEIIEEAQRRAQRILDETDAQANVRRTGADQYAQATLQKLEEELSQVINTIRHGIEVMDVEREPSA